MSLLGRVLFGAADLVVSGMKSQAKSYSRDKNYSDEQREKWSDLSEGLGEWQTGIRDARDRMKDKETK